MPAQTFNKVTVPAANDLFNLTTDLKKAIETAGIVVPVASPTERSSVQSAASAAGVGTASKPLFVYRTDLKQLEVYTGSWTVLTGQQTTATPTLSTGWTAASMPTIVRNGNHATMNGTLLFGTDANFSNILTIPAGYRPGAGTIPIGVGIVAGSPTGTNNATITRLFCTAGVVQTVPGYSSASHPPRPLTITSSWLIEA